VKIGLISEVYGNLPALEAAWTWLSSEGSELVICLGDLVGYGPFPEEVICFVREHGIETVQGNWDRAVGRGRDDSGDSFESSRWRSLAYEVLRWTIEKLTSSGADYLSGLPHELRFVVGRSRILCVHGLPGNVSGRVAAYAGNDVFDSLLERNHCDILLSGNTGVPAIAVRPSGYLVNPGSVGGGSCPSAATAAVLEAGDKAAVPVWWQRIEYDFEKYERTYLESGLPEIFLRCLRTGRAPTGEWITDDTVWRQRWAER
jgi:putative phosphoesterase